mmetsp:Transcript_49209/g.87884  ORF Transcript_49209/g.87884 Transcript_49209/m.87884 type:complete len:96 (-) Transcript_49209:299-586(-)
MEDEEHHSPPPFFRAEEYHLKHATIIRKDCVQSVSLVVGKQRELSHMLATRLIPCCNGRNCNSICQEGNCSPKNTVEQIIIPLCCISATPHNSSC